ncbi:hypothetical protein COCON_G00219080 [Conger conger]|uniref:Uncharacterized protein n=1 Tax=Conger conger TaxID=82655 RepID=A0A9Q1CYJ2_CONCO|nr:hypothetical protein COCON_G00219080 [Conger conger]
MLKRNNLLFKGGRRGRSCPAFIGGHPQFSIGLPSAHFGKAFQRKFWKGRGGGMESRRKEKGMCQFPRDLVKTRHQCPRCTALRGQQ